MAGVYCRRNVGSCRATPSPAPHRLRESWERALGDEMALSIWRSPQIVILRAFQTDWPTSFEVDILCHPCGDTPESGPHPRVLVLLEEYEDHPFAGSDVDPWDRRHISQAAKNGPCCLPRPPVLERVRFADLERQLQIARARGWEQPGRRHFIPPPEWKPVAISKVEWRQSAFPEGRTSDGHSGPVDYRGLVWEWDPWHGGHWDVQLDPEGRLERTRTRHIRVSHTGEVI